jgi:predicted DNA-binding ribbon-helix-helix protein
MTKLRRRTPRRQPSLIVKRSIQIGDLKTGVSLENEFFDALNEIAAAQGAPTSALILMIDKRRRQQQRRMVNLSSAIRVYVLGYYMKRAEEVRRESLTGKQWG